MDSFDPAEMKGRVMRELCDIGFADITDYVEVVSDDGEPKLRFRDTSDISPEKRAAIVAIKMGSKGIEIKLADKLSALEKLGRCFGLFEKKEEADTENIDEMQSEIFGGDDDEQDFDT